MVDISLRTPQPATHIYEHEEVARQHTPDFTLLMDVLAGSVSGEEVSSADDANERSEHGSSAIGVEEPLESSDNLVGRIWSSLRRSVATTPATESRRGSRLIDGTTIPRLVTALMDTGDSDSDAEQSDSEARSIDGDDEYASAEEDQQPEVGHQNRPNHVLGGNVLIDDSRPPTREAFISPETMPPPSPSEPLVPLYDADHDATMTENEPILPLFNASPDVSPSTSRHSRARSIFLPNIDAFDNSIKGNLTSHRRNKTLSSIIPGIGKRPSEMEQMEEGHSPFMSTFDRRG